MSLVVPTLLGYLLGSIPTATWLARLAGVNLLRQGSQNPGTTNAWRLRGFRPAVPVLLAELGKGAGAVALGGLLAGDPGGLAAGVGAVGGHILNPWFRLRGGKGLAVAAGVTLAAWPPGLLAGVVLAIGTRVTGSSARGVVLALLAYLSGAALWGLLLLPNPWGVVPGSGLMITALLLVVLMLPKFMRENAR